jgi:hypothetical protein
MSAWSPSSRPLKPPVKAKVVTHGRGCLLALLWLLQTYAMQPLGDLDQAVYSV